VLTSFEVFNPVETIRQKKRELWLSNVRQSLWVYCLQMLMITWNVRGLGEALGVKDLCMFYKADIWCFQRNKVGKCE